MKKALAVLFVIALAGAVMAGCTGNRSFIDTTYSFSRAIVYAPDGTKVAEGKVESWHDYDDSDQLQVKIDGRTYLTAAENVIMVAE